MTRRRARALRAKGYMNIVDLAGFLGVSVETLRRWRMSGRLPQASRCDEGVSLWSPDQVTELLNMRSKKA